MTDDDITEQQFEDALCMTAAKLWEKLPRDERLKIQRNLTPDQRDEAARGVQRGRRLNREIEQKTRRK
ncbi:hypothetical protein ACFQ1S_27490 [Kibdelosporangium lantanae]|uniref:Uncharacterized protein n=1 Tax=Kibdelosporangium lantanae TaxID=1497396 RepID=A0ABW3MG57_9PSEU